MTDRIEDLIGRIAMILAFTALAALQVHSIAAVIRDQSAMALWPLVLASRVFGMVFLLFVVFFTLRRLPPRKSAPGVGPRVVAIAGTFITMFLVVLPSSEVPPELKILATILIAMGTGLSAFCIVWLGRSFSIMATSRQLVVKGPYRFIRHPLYAAESLTVLGIIIANWSVWAALFGIVWAALQYQRVLNEESVLRATFAEYDEYARAVPRFFPDLLSAFGLRASRSS
ncbi:MAG TPA: isoprenylcysteine carboxylmethyltransferase family protein [Rhizomicrobium sp.]|nr:isoprenylcysteine carboxylmethyltransferase family protein [Rhizomicrobium sp.]